MAKKPNVAQDGYRKDAEALADLMAGEIYVMLTHERLVMPPDIERDEFREWAFRLIVRFGARQRVKAKREVRAQMAKGEGKVDG